MSAAGVDGEVAIRAAHAAERVSGRRPPGGATHRTPRRSESPTADRVDSQRPMIYLDNAASTPPAPEALEAMTQAARDHFANPSSAHALGAAAARALEQARGEVAALAGRQPGARSCSPAAGPRPTRWGSSARPRAAARAAPRGQRHRAPGRAALGRAAGRARLPVTLVAPGPDGRRAARGGGGGGAARDRRGGGHAGEQRARHAPAGGRDRPGACGAAGCRGATSTATRSRRPGWCRSTCARWAPTRWRVSAHKLHGPRGRRARCGCGRGRAWRRCGTAAARNAACARGPRTCPPGRLRPGGPPGARAGDARPRWRRLRDRLESGDRRAACPRPGRRCPRERRAPPTSPACCCPTCRPSRSCTRSRRAGSSPRPARPAPPGRAGPATCSRPSACPTTRRCCASPWPGDHRRSRTMPGGRGGARGRRSGEVGAVARPHDQPRGGRPSAPARSSSAASASCSSSWATAAASSSSCCRNVRAALARAARHRGVEPRTAAWSCARRRHSLEEACSRLERVFGLVSFSPAREVAAGHRGDRRGGGGRRRRRRSSAIPGSGAASASRPAGRTSASR